MDVVNQNIGLAWQFQAVYHKNQLSRLRKSLGKDCTYISHITQNGQRFIKAVLLNRLGGKDTVEVPINSDLSQVKDADYDTVLKILGERRYERDTKTV